ncbi:MULTISPECIES: hypothetical protein [unclassified Mycolicibacterium]|uniref:hypothetical protein n=1 Tax=unclassified Mycolicibacterium TaxID=2636767 RepID=UPI0012DF3A06|nr:MULTISPECIES: hypothetical protein [unclassified Mycolicibacterium]MUL82939.1 hypothetical protein [Mycolicibacterium sp. CBMA 329]MUL89274.1 hypothetical protein [Mycolicibacterium sp. CBMA 331]MUL97840.1 hypothetical protein [Mycolicibacterium sp. CBMA 334]MUM29930.1 hypothetical protein [Mycolicibacterium sp. CBMA 295]MUM38790.1 hypothetical protein [Mycolicibacterium sp. CBMA 247]
MLIAALLCLSTAVIVGVLGLWLLTRPRSGDPVRSVLRAVAPTQLAAAVMLAAGGAAALAAAPQMGLMVVMVCIIGAVATVAAGCWQSAKSVAHAEAQAEANTGSGAGCVGSCASCTLSCK